MKKVLLLITALLSAPAAFSDAELYFVSLQDGDKVSGEISVRFGLRGMGVAPAGVEVANTGHHHLLIDLDELPPINLPLPKTEQIRHFGGGQTETTLSLAPGTHTLQLLLGNHLHIPHDPPVISRKISITVE